MKRFTVPTILAAGTFFVMSGMSLSAAASESDNLCADIVAEISEPGVCASERDGVVTLTGVVESQMDKKAAERAAKKFDGVDEVRNMISVSN